MKNLRNVKNGMKKVFTCFLALLLILTILPAYALNYYVDPSSWGSNAGTFTDPWRSIGDIPWSINYFLPGDTIFFKRGQQFSGTLSINSSGISGSPIVFMPYGSGNAPLFQYNLASPPESRVENRMIIRLNQVNHVIIDGFELTDATIPEFDHSVTANVGNGVYIYNQPGGNNGSYNIIKNLTISRLGAGAIIDGGSYNTITDCTIRNMRMVVNTPHINWDDHGAVGITLGGSNNTITHNHIEDCWAYSFDYQYDGGAIEMYGPVNNNSILYNTAVDNLGFMEFGSHTGAQSFNNLVGYNLLINNGHLCWINVSNGFGVDVRNLQLFNNNIIETNPPRIADITSLIGIFTPPTVSNVITLKNNIFWLARPLNITDPVLQPFNGPQLVHENNLYHLSGGSLGYTLHSSELNLKTSDLLFMDITSGNPVTWNYNLRPSAAAIDFGQNTGIVKDFYGNAVPFRNAPDAGIAEDVSAVLPLQIISCRGWSGTNGNNIEWVTTNDTAGHFEIERKYGGNNFQKIAVVPYKMNVSSSTSVKYQFIDKDVMDESQYYRIKVIERDNTIFYSQIISIKNNLLSTDVIVAPNPVQDNLYIRIPGNDFRNKELVMYNMSGIEVSRSRINEVNTQLKMNVSKLPRGVYVIKLIDYKTGRYQKAMFTK